VKKLKSIEDTTQGSEILGMRPGVRCQAHVERFEAGSFHLILTRFQPGEPAAF